MEKQISITWHVDDIIEQSKLIGNELDEYQACLVLKKLKDNHDAEVGINWDVINFWISKIAKK